MDTLELTKEKELEKRHYAENDRIHNEFWGKPDFSEKIKELDAEFRKRFMSIFKKN